MKSLVDSLSGILKLVKAFYHVPYAFVAIVDESGTWTTIGDGVDLRSEFFLKLRTLKTLCVDEHNIGVPILDRHMNMKAIFCIPNHHSRIFCQYEIDFMATYGSQISLLLEHSEMQKIIEQQNEGMIQYSRLATLGQMTSEIVHEINNPISIIQARLEMMLVMAKKGELSPEMLITSIEKLLVTRERISRIIDGVKNFSRNGDHDAFESVDLNDLLQYSIDFCSDRLNKSSVELKLEPVSEPIFINCRTIQISQVIVNLLNNAIDATQGIADRWIRIVAERSDHRVQIKVIDCGLGIPPEEQKKLFKPFFTSKPKGQGTGLGLSISKNIVELHQGNLHYAETDGHTSFVIDLPTIGS